MQKHRFSLMFYLIAACLALLASSQELVFSGFVELASTAHAEEAVDFSKVEIQLFTDNKFIDKTLCSQNGFFLLPVYDKKSYVIKVKPPQESTFEPESIAIDLRGKTTEEVTKITESSLSFKFIGFSLKGDVKVEGSQHAPTGVRLELIDSKGIKVGTTETQEGGQFRFDRVMTGRYKVKFENNNSGFYWNEGSGAITCELGWKKGQECTGSLVISSFEVRGGLSSHSQILNKHTIFLYSEDPAVRGRNTLSPIKDHPLAASNREYISYSKINADGTFRFERIPKGDYLLKIYSSDKGNNIEIEPDTYKFAVEDRPVNVESPFTVRRFSVSGKVVDQEGKGLSGIKILLDSDNKAVSDSRGYYQIERISAGKYTLEGQDEHLFFNPISDLQLDPSSASLPNLVLSAVHLCGEVSLKGGINDNEFASAKIVVYLERQGEKRSSHIGKDDRYCFEVQPGRYNIFPVVIGASAAKQETLFYPKSREVQISNEPILDVNFFRPRLSLEGEVRLLQNVKASSADKTKIILTSGSGVQKATTLGNNRRFKFEQILPGSYDIHIENENLCWKDENKRVDLINSNITNVVFEQVGFALKYQTSRPLEVRLTPIDGKPIDTSLLPSSNSYCVEKAGVYKIIPDICYQFSAPEFKVSTDDETPVVLEPVGFLVRGEVNAPEALGQNLDSNQTLSQFIVDNIHVSLSTPNTNPPKRNLLRLQYSKTENGILRFFYNYYVPANTDVTVEAKPKAKLEGKAEQIVSNLLFNPSEVRLHVGDTCVLDNADNQIEIRQGLIFVGSVKPALSDWIVNVHYESAPEGKDSLVESLPRRDSSFKLGPYMDLYKYSITAEKEGYKFETVLKEEGYNLYRVTFNAQKLSHLRITVLDDDKRPVPGALIFVSSMAKKDALKLSNYTNEKGVFSTHQLVKGDYFIRAVLKEYSFEPSQTTIRIEDGEHKEITLLAKRVAYSAYGKIQTLSKGGCQGLKVVATPQSTSVPTEIAETDAEGNYRIKGLTPGYTYIISVEKSTGEGNVQYSNIRPEKIVIQAQPRDARNVDFIGFQRKQTYTVAGTVLFDKTFTEENIDQIEQIQIRLYKKGQSEPLDAANVRLFRYFEFKNLQPADYTIRTLIKRGKNQLPSEYSQEIPASSFGENHFVSSNVEISKEKSKSAHDSSAKGSYMAPIVILIIIFLFLNMDTLLTKYRKYSENKDQQANKRRL